MPTSLASIPDALRSQRTESHLCFCALVLGGALVQSTAGSEYSPCFSGALFSTLFCKVERFNNYVDLFSETQVYFIYLLMIILILSKFNCANALAWSLAQYQQGSTYSTYSALSV